MEILNKVQIINKQDIKNIHIIQILIINKIN